MRPGLRRVSCVLVVRRVLGSFCGRGCKTLRMAIKSLQVVNRLVKLLSVVIMVVSLYPIAEERQAIRRMTRLALIPFFVFLSLFYGSGHTLLRQLLLSLSVLEARCHTRPVLVPLPVCMSHSRLLMWRKGVPVIL